MLLKCGKMYFYMRTLRTGGGKHVPSPTTCSSLTNHLFFWHVATWWRTKVSAPDTGVLLLLVCRTEQYVFRINSSESVAASLFPQSFRWKPLVVFKKEKSNPFLDLLSYVWMFLSIPCTSILSESDIYMLLHLASYPAHCCQTVRTSSRLDFSPVTNT